MTVPLLFGSTRSASRRMAKWAERVDLAIGKCSASSPAFIGFLRSNCRICRRVGSESALKTKFIFRYLAKYRILSISENGAVLDATPASDIRFGSQCFSCYLYRAHLAVRLLLKLL